MQTVDPEPMPRQSRWRANGLTAILALIALPDEFVTAGLAFCNPDDGQTLPLLHTGLASSGGAMPYQMWKKSLGRRNWHFDFLELVIFRSPVIEFLLNDVSKIRN